MSSIKTSFFFLFALVMALSASAQVRGGAVRHRTTNAASGVSFDAKYLELSAEIGESAVYNKIKQRYLKDDKKDKMEKEDVEKEEKEEKEESEDEDMSMSLSMSLSMSMSIML
ncbi:hypothetical protein IV203_025967 [Nitzschia inconspicua]|uniref:Uncharacterized protein n=1 Tax=Nitzschia inconspicua TaxID=303405 RepID=A0A9K3LK52_9STRA|nr:hypothetical protein IV203_025967 [Nitzschia inconspicua]